MSDSMIFELEKIIRERKLNAPEDSYTAKLFRAGPNKISQKVGEEAVEVVVAALGQSREEQVGELADLIYHTMVLMAQLDISLEDVEAKLRERHQK